MQSEKFFTKILKLVLVLIGLVLLIDFWPRPIRSIWVRYPQLDQLRLATKFTDPFYFPTQLKRSSLPHYQLNIKPNDLDKINSSLPQPYTFTIYSRLQQVDAPGTFIGDDDKSYLVKARVHGDLYHHWSGAKKSWRIKFDDNTLDGYKEITLLLPETRDFLIESLVRFRAEKLGLIALDSWFVTLSINGEDQGIYFVQEHWTKDLLEKNQRMTDGDLFGELDLENVWDWPELFVQLEAWKKYTQNPVAQKDFSSIKVLLELFQSDPTSIFDNAQRIIDVGSFARWQAHSMLFPSFHQDNGHNMRIFFNRDSGLFEFIPFDLEPSLPQENFDDRDYNQLVTLMLQVPEIKSMRDQILIDYVSDDKNLADDLKFYDALFRKVRSSFAADSQKAYSTLFFVRNVAEHRANLIKQFSNIKKEVL